VVNALHMPAPANIPTVALDERDIGHMAGEYLVKCGYRRFAFYGTEQNWSRERFAGFQSAIAGKQTQIVLNTMDGGSRWPCWWEACVPEYVQEFVDKLTPPTAVFACNDVMARHVADACLAKGLHVPSQAAILGVDNDMALCESSDLTLSTVELDMERLGYEAAAMLKQMLAGDRPRHVEVMVRPRGIVARRSTDPEAFEDKDVAAAIGFIRASACEGISVSSICKHISISRREMERRFREATGHSPGEEIRRVRMDQARELLATTNLPVMDICVRCGYEHLPSFTTAFRKTVGITPRAYRLSTCRKGEPERNE
jgi:LacI family transcriptional regulator